MSEPQLFDLASGGAEGTQLYGLVVCRQDFFSFRGVVPNSIKKQYQTTLCRSRCYHICYILAGIPVPSPPVGFGRCSLDLRRRALCGSGTQTSAKQTWGLRGGVAVNSGNWMRGCSIFFKLSYLSFLMFLVFPCFSWFLCRQFWSPRQNQISDNLAPGIR